MGGNKYDFSGYVTKNNVMCNDGRVIRHNAFKDQDGVRVPLVWQHMHDEPSNVLGFVDLENREDGVYGYGAFNNAVQGQHAKELVKHGDVDSMSIWANGLSQQGNNVLHGVIREVSLVLAGANPEAKIENVALAHADGYEDILEDQAVIEFGSKFELMHSSSVYRPENKPALIHADTEDDKNNENKNDTENQNGSNEDPTIEEVLNTLTDEQMAAVEYIVGLALEEDEEDNDDSDSDDSEKGDDMGQIKHNVFDQTDNSEDVISHDAMKEIIADGRRMGSMRESFIQHGIENLEVLYPEAKVVTPEPDMITRRMDWVSDVWNSLKKTPFSRIKSVAADLTEDDARAKGYIKGDKKIEEQFTLLTRVTTPQTVYKKQSMDRDDIIDITDFDTVAWLKREMRMMLDEELSRAVMVGDGRLVTSSDKIKEDNIRPIYQDDDMYTIHWDVTAPSGVTDPNEISNNLVDQALRSRKEYKGSGNPVFYASVDVINDMLLARDKVGRRLYATVDELASALRVSRIVEIPVFEGVTRTDSDGGKHELVGIIVNLSDYSLGTDRNGEVNFFDDFDIDYNKEKYLIETRVSGALTHPYSAIALEKSAEGLVSVG